MTTPRHLQVVLAAGFASLVAAITIAASNPATGYELSIYRGTPAPFWIGCGLAFLAAVPVSLHSDTGRWYRRGSFLLAYLVALAVVALPTIRGYYLPGAGDNMTHLGWIKELGAGVLAPSGLLYPATHTITVIANDVGGLPYRHAQELTVLALIAVYLCAVPLCVHRLVDHRGSLLIGLLTAFLWLPANGISVHLAFHPFSLGVLFLAFVLYLIVVNVTRSRTREGSTFRPTADGALLGLATVAATLIHPQVGMLVAALLVAVAVVQFWLRRVGSSHPITSHGTLYGQATFASAFFLLWTYRFARPERVVIATVQGILDVGDTGDEVAQRSASIGDLGGSIGELFVKLFLPSVVFLGIVALYLLVRWFRRNDRLFAGDNGAVEYVAIAAALSGVAFVVTFLGGVTTMHFRYLGAAMLPVAVLGAVALSAFVRARTGTARSISAATVVVLLVVVLLPMSTMVLYSSPYIYQASSHVTEEQVDGYSTMLEHRDADVRLTGIRKQFPRYVDVIVGTVESGTMRLEAEEGIPGPVFDTNLSTHYEDQQYAVVSQKEYEREVITYDGFRYSRQGFEALDTTPGIQRVQSNGPVQQYLFGGSDDRT